MSQTAAERPRLLIVAGPNGAGKTTVTDAGLAHRWFAGCEYINPDLIAQRELGDWNDPKAVLQTDSPDINAARVARRMLQGGHEVPIRKIIDRWSRSIANCATVATRVDRLYLYDNSVDHREAELVLRTTE